MRTIIAGSRDCTDKKYLLAALEECGWLPTVVISGDARGADTLGEEWAIENDIPVEKFPADWATYGKSAGFLRNEEMAKNADALIALWDGQSTGTKHMIACAKKHGLKIRVYLIYQSRFGIL